MTCISVKMIELGQCDIPIVAMIEIRKVSAEGFIHVIKNQKNRCQCNDQCNGSYQIWHYTQIGLIEPFKQRYCIDYAVKWS